MPDRAPDHAADHAPPGPSPEAECGILINGSYRFGKQPVVPGVRPQFVSAKGTAQMATVSHFPPPGGLCRTVADPRPDRVLLHVSGQVDLSCAPALAHELTGWINRGPAVLIEASGIEFIDCAGLRVLLRARSLDPTLALLNPSACVLRLLALMGADFPVRAGAAPECAGARDRADAQAAGDPGHPAGPRPAPPPGAPGPD